MDATEDVSLVEPVTRSGDKDEDGPEAEGFLDVEEDAKEEKLVRLLSRVQSIIYLCVTNHLIIIHYH